MAESMSHFVGGVTGVLWCDIFSCCIYPGNLCLRKSVRLSSCPTLHSHASTLQATGLNGKQYFKCPPCVKNDISAYLDTFPLVPRRTRHIHVPIVGKNLHQTYPTMMMNRTETFDSGAFYVLLGPRANLDQEPCQNSSTTTMTLSMRFL
jgi:hypothetical protein